MIRSDDQGALRDYLKKWEQEIEFQSLKLARIYRVDHHELISRTYRTVWEKWQLISAFEDDAKRNRYWLGVLANHARNLLRKQQGEWAGCQPASHQLECDVTESSSWRDPAIEALFKDEEFRIYRAIAQLSGRSRDVMSLRALGMSDDDARAELEMTPTYFSTALSRARRELREILNTGGHEDGGTS